MTEQPEHAPRQHVMQEFNYCNFGSFWHSTSSLLSRLAITKISRKDARPSCHCLLGRSAYSIFRVIQGASKLALNAVTVMPIAFVLTCCGDQDKRTPQSYGDIGSGTADQKHSDSVLNVRSFGIPSTDLLLPYVTNTTADCGSHFWIYGVARNGDFCRALLFVRDPASETTARDVYSVAFRNGTEDRVRLTNEEAEREIEFIEQVLVATGMKDFYDSCFAEELPNSEQEDEAKEGDLSGEESRVDAVVSDDTANRKIAEKTNGHTVRGIACVVREFRAANDSATPNTTSHPNSPQPANDMVSPTPKESLPDDRRLTPRPPQESQGSDIPDSEP